MKRILTLIIAVFLVQFASAQTVEQYEKTAQEAYDAKNWSKALTYYNILIEIDSTRNNARFYGGHSAYNMRSHRIAKDLLLGISAEARTGEFAATNFLLGNVEKGQEDYANAISSYSIFIDQNPIDLGIYIERAQLELDYCEWALEQKNYPTTTELIHLDENVNTVYCDMSPFVQGNSLYYTSALTDDEYSDKNRFKIVKTVDDMNRMPIGMNSEERYNNVANYQINDTGDRLVYTVCDEGGMAGYDCLIYQMRKQSDESWSPRELLSDKVNVPGTNNTHPALGRDSDSGMELLFFSSNRPGGEGEMDIWFSVITETGDISVPVNIEEVNSAQDDVTPFFHNGSQVLYFGSMGFKGMGGFDLYSSQKNNNDWIEATNLGYPTNSGYDDLYYTFDDVSGNAHFVSNRLGSICTNEELDCVNYDIYRLPITVNLDVFAFNGIDSTDLVGTQIELMNLTTGTVDTISVNELANDYLFPLILGQDYRVTAIKDGYSTATTEFTTKGIYTSTTITKNLYFTPSITLIVYTFDAISREPLNGTSVIMTNKTSSEVSRGPNPETTNKSEYTIAFGQKYNVFAEKLAYSTSELVSFNTIGLNSPTQIVKNLYIQPFTGLPITVYFDNDYPNPRTIQTTCDKTYDITFNRYITRKETFMTSYSTSLTGYEKEEAKNAIGSFFDNEVQVGYDKLTKFSNTLVTYFESGTVDTIEIELQGYASPIAKTDYNNFLTSRRTDSVQNHFEKVNEKILMQYIQNGRLRFVESPKGEASADANVSDKPGNRRDSVFSPEASRERRVRIIDIRSKDENLSVGY
ncbi:MAG: hypothetical protein ACI85O_001245 [Saprospiraceae bacterium]|jgi:hypothetical protein